MDDDASVGSSVASGKRRSSMLQPAGDSIKVICRFRPPKTSEIENHGQSTTLDCFRIDEGRGTVETMVDYEKKFFTFDKIFGIGATQSQIFDAVSGIVDSVMEGFNGTILAYGQTSSGKTHTMEGPSLWDMESQGVIPRTIDKFFSRMADAESSVKFTVSVSYFEVYCEKIRDLLNPTQDNMKIRETKGEGLAIQDLTEVYCTNREGVISIIETGKSYRACAPTLMNAESSRSHSILSLLVTQKDEKTGRNKRGKVFLVDLAGSEKVSKTGATGARLEEAKNINRSLTTLGMVINALCDGTAHIPYRDSKLTRILQDSLGGNSKTTLIVCCAPEERHGTETVGTLRFGERAKKIKNNAKINEELGIPELKQMLAVAKAEIVKLKLQLENGQEGKTPAVGTLLARETSDGPPITAEGQVAVTETDTTNSPVNNPTSTNLSPSGATTSQFSDEDSEDDSSSKEGGNKPQIRIAELEDALDEERRTLAAEQDRNIILHTETLALKSTIEELEEKLLQAKMEARLSRTMSADNEKGSSKETIAALQADSNSAYDRQDTPELTDYDDQRAMSDEMVKTVENMNLQSLTQESDQLKNMFEEEIQALESTLVAREEATKTARATAAEYAEKYAKLKAEHDFHIQRLVLKLSQEQHARTELEDQLELALQNKYRSPDEGSGAGGFFKKIFNATPGPTDTSSGSRTAMMKKERELMKEIEKLKSRNEQLTSSMESTKEAQRIVLETKESVMRSLLKQNVAISQERDVLGRRVEDLSTTVEQLTALLRNLQNRASKQIVATSNIIVGGKHS
jgi:kinesin family protein 5